MAGIFKYTKNKFIDKPYMIVWRLEYINKLNKQIYWKSRYGCLMTEILKWIKNKVIEKPDMVVWRFEYLNK